MISSSSNTAWPSWSAQATLFVHIPKTGGTTLDAIFRDHYFDTPLLPSTPFKLFGQHIAKFNDPAYRYIGGHYPLSTMDCSRFDHTVTVLRDPLESLCSGISYMNKLKGLPQEALTEAELSGLPALTYKKFFTTHFDTARYLIDLSYGIDKGMRQYLYECAASDAVDNVRKFTHVFDFQHFEGEVKRFLIEQHYFPYAEIGKKRQYAYQPDHARAKLLLSEFDEKFYQLARPLLTRVPDDIHRKYEQYREEYCRHRGLDLAVHQGCTLDLRMPLGSGWHHVEQSEDNTCFRWSEPETATIDIPVAAAGLYAVYLYIHPVKTKAVRLSVSTTIHPASFTATLHENSHIRVYRLVVSTRSHDWISIVLHMERDSEREGETMTMDERERGIILGNVYICRHPQ